MRYLKVLILAVFFFLALVFFFQNQTSLSQEMQLTLNLFFVPPITSISLPFYFLLLGAFMIGCLLSLFLLVWDKFTTSARLVKTKWRVSSLEAEVARLRKQIDKLTPAALTVDAGVDKGAGNAQATDAAKNSDKDKK